MQCFLIKTLSRVIPLIHFLFFMDLPDIPIIYFLLAFLKIRGGCPSLTNALGFPSQGDQDQDWNVFRLRASNHPYQVSRIQHTGFLFKLDIHLKRLF
jgi:hypothetical protein